MTALARIHHHGRRGRRPHEDQRRADAGDPGRRRDRSSSTAIFPSASKLIRPDPASVANAIGAAIAQVGGEVGPGLFARGQEPRRGCSPPPSPKRSRARWRRARPRTTVKIIGHEEVPLAYLPGSASRIRVKAVRRPDRRLSPARKAP